MHEDSADRFWSKVGRCAPDTCWLWQAATDKNGYGSFVLPGRRGWRKERAHRIAYELVNGQIPDGQWCLHHCDNPSCVNPEHLFLGTNQENVADRQAKWRQARGLRQGAHTRPERRVRGERVGNHKLSEHQVLQVRDLLNAGRLSQRAIAREFGVHQGTISMIATGKSWSHI